MNVSLFISHEVQDYDRWKSAYDDTQSIREENAVQSTQVHRHIDSPNKVTVYHQFTDLESAQEFLKTFQTAQESDDPEMQELVNRFGIIQPVDIWFAEEVE
jgi:quinol monooxygenase YgiN